MGPGKNDRGLSRKHILESIDASLRRLQMEYVDVYQAHRYDNETPLEETMQAFADVVRAGKALYIGVSEWTADQIRAGVDLARQLGVSLVSNQPQYSMLWRVIESRVVPTSEELGVGQIVFSPIAQGILTGKYRPGEQPPAGSRATDDKGGANMIRRYLTDDDVLTRVQRLQPIADDAGLSMASARHRLGAAERQRLSGHHRCQPAGTGRRQRRRCRQEAGRRPAEAHRRDPRPGGRARRRQTVSPKRRP